MTLNQVIKRIETIALSHKQVREFFYGDPVDFLTRKDLTYPACFLNMSRGRIDVAERQTIFSFRIWLCDLVDVAINSQKNETEVQSDLTRVMEDFVASFGYTGYKDWDLYMPGQIEYASEVYEDLVAAVIMDFEIGVRFEGNRCQIPTTQLFETDFNAVPAGNLLIDSDGAFIVDSDGSYLTDV